MYRVFAAFQNRWHRIWHGIGHGITPKLHSSYTYAYDGANRNISVTRAPGTGLAATSQTVYDWDGRVQKTIDPLNNETERLYVGCCDHTQVSENALGHGSISKSLAQRGFLSLAK